MRPYIATVYYASSVALAVDGDKALQRRIIRHAAASPAYFIAYVRDSLGAARDVDMAVEFGPIGTPWSQS